MAERGLIKAKPASSCFIFLPENIKSVTLMGMTATEKILSRASGRNYVRPGEMLDDVKIDIAMTHDVTSGIAIDVLEKMLGGKVWDVERIIVTPDHYVPCKDIASATLYKELMDFSERQGLKNVYPVGGNYGVCHSMLPQEGHVRPGEVIVGSDSHTCAHGALGAFATGIGSKDLGNVFATGKLWFKVPETQKYVLNGSMPQNVMAKDLILRIIGDIGVGGAVYKAMEFAGDAVDGMSIDERYTLCNMAVEAGGKSGIILPDDKTLSFVRERTNKDFAPVYNDADAEFEFVKLYDVSDMTPLVAKPNLPSNVAPASELYDTKIDQAYIGGCTGGKLEDFKAAAKVLKGNKKAKNVRLLVVPSTQKIYRAIMDSEMKDIYMDAGAVISAPTCGACLGGHMGIIAEWEVCISATNRNFRGRMGHPNSYVYLASPMTVAASAINGYITGAEI